jgi:hypothetical protein
VRNNDLSLDAREGFRNDGGRRRFLVFACDGHRRFVVLAHVSIEAISPCQIFGWVSPDVQGFLWAWGSGCSVSWGGRWGGRVGLVGRLAVWFSVGCSSELLPHFLEFGSDASDLFLEFADSVFVGSLGGEHSLFHAFKLE